MRQNVKPHAAVAMSGGVDSAVTALLMQNAGFDLLGITMRLYRDGEARPLADGENAVHEIAASEEIRDAQSVAALLGIEHRVLYLESTFCSSVIDPFVQAYQEGLTPNPCVICNKRLKFGKLLDYALANGCDTYATGHYARITHENGRHLVRCAKDPLKDQSYMLWSLSQEVLAHVRLPLGDYSKDEVREIAAENGFCNARKHDSQDICFIPDGDYVSFLRRFAGIVPTPGDYVDTSGTKLGRHAGMIAYTVGQRKGLGVAFGEPMYVLGKNAATGCVTLGRNEQLFSHQLRAVSPNFIAFDSLGDSVLRCQARIRYSHHAAPCTVTCRGENELNVVFDEPQRAVTPGQSVVFYDGDLLLGGAFIAE